MRVLVTGVKGQLGYDVMEELIKRNHDAVGVDIEEMDITDKFSVEKIIKKVHPDAVIHCAAWTAVDAAEDFPDKVHLVNAIGTENIAAICSKLDCKMMYISTDYVFNGEGANFWKPNDFRQPLNTYGRSKYEGELAVEHALRKYFIVRTAWVFGLHGNNFIKTMLALGKSHNNLTVVNDQIGSPTYTYDLARLLVDIIETDKFGCYHATNEGICSWYDFACEIFRQGALMGHNEYAIEQLSIEPVTADCYPSKAKRPSNSRMSKEKLTESGFEPLPPWQDAVSRYLKKIQF